MAKMNLERMDHFLRHMKRHAEEVRSGNFNKDIGEYSLNLSMAQALALEVSHDMIHVMRMKEFKGYENADFDFVVKLPENWENHEFRDFDVTSFRIGCRLKATLDLCMVDEKNIRLECSDAERQLEVLANAVQDAEVLLEMLIYYPK